MARVRSPPAAPAHRAVARPDRRGGPGRRKNLQRSGREEAGVPAGEILPADRLDGGGAGSSAWRDMQGTASRRPEPRRPWPVAHAFIPGMMEGNRHPGPGATARLAFPAEGHSDRPSPPVVMGSAGAETLGEDDSKANDQSDPCCWRTENRTVGDGLSIKNERQMRGKSFPLPLGTKPAPIGPHHPLRIARADQSGLDAAIEITAGCGAGNTVQLGRQRATFASGIEARRAETPQGGSVYESPARGVSARTPSYLWVHLHDFPSWRPFAYNRIAPQLGRLARSPTTPKAEVHGLQKAPAIP